MMTVPRERHSLATVALAIGGNVSGG